MLTAYGFSGYGAEPVEPISTFAHVLNLPESEDIWRCEWVSQFPQHLFSTAFVGGSKDFALKGMVWEHQRYELLRLARAHFPNGCHERTVNSHLAFHRWVINEMFEFTSQDIDLETSIFETGSENMYFDDVEPQALDESFEVTTLRPKRPVSVILPLEASTPIEQEDN